MGRIGLITKIRTVIPRPGQTLTGRDEELAVLDQALDSVETGATEIVVVTGEPGIGKTALARCLAGRAEERGFKVSWSSCWTLDEVPAFWPWRPVISALGGTGELLASTSEIGPANLFDELSTVLRRAVEEAPVLVVLDDAQGADEASLSVMGLCARSLRNTAAMFLLTVCEEDVPNKSRKARLLDAVGRQATRVDLFGLGARDSLALVEQLNGEAPPPIIGEGVVSASAGNPFLLKEIARELRASGDIRRPDASLGYRVPKGAHAVTDRVLSRLSDRTLEVLGTAAILGRTFNTKILRRLLDDTDLAEVLDEAARAGAIRAIDALGTFEFTHVLVREALYEGIGSRERSLLHLRAAETLETMEDEAHISEIAHHLFKAGIEHEPERAVEALLKAARQARQVGSDEEAARHSFRARRLATAAGLPLPSETESAVEVAQQQPDSLLPVTGDAVFLKEGEFWTVSYAGATTRLRDSKGLYYLARLLRDPHREFHALDLAGSTGRRSSGQADTGPLIDDSARASYKRRLNDLEEEIAEASAAGDYTRREKSENERDFLIKELKAAAGLGGRARRSGSDSERARVSITRAIRSALRRISSANQPLGEHLDRAIHTGTFLSYDPDPNTTPSWRL